MQRFGVGFAAPFRGGAFLARRPHLWGWVVFPVILLAAGLFGALWLVWANLPPVMDAMWPPTGSPAVDSLQRGLKLGLLLLVFGFAAIVAWAVSMVVATPFYDQLAERVEREVLGLPEVPFSLSVALGDAGWSIAHTLLALGLYLLASAVLVAFGFVPAIGNVLAPVGEIVVTCTFLARELLDMPLARRRVGFADKLRFLWRHLAMFEGLGASSALLLWVPLLNFVSMPAAVVGATLLYARLEREGAEPAYSTS